MPITSKLLLAAGIVALAFAAYANSFNGINGNFADGINGALPNGIYNQIAGATPPPPVNCLLAQTGSPILAQTGSCIRVQ